MTISDSEANIEKHARAIGLVIAVPFAAITIWLDSYILARAQNGETTYAFGKGYATSFTLACMGLALAAGGPTVARFLRSLLTRKRNLIYIVMVLTIASPGLLAYFWLLHRIGLLQAGSH
jgi:hypothetical protein